MQLGDLVKWRYSDSDILGTVLKDLGVQTITKKYLIFWFQSGIIMECYSSDVEVYDKTQP